MYYRHPTPKRVTLTRRHHPLRGQEMEVVLGGPRIIVVRLRDGTSMRVPRAWTDADGAQVEGPENIFTVESLHELAALLDALARHA